MALAIDYVTRIISVPKADLTLIQSSPFEILELDIDAFRLELKDIEDSVPGVPFVDTHRHFTTVTVGGVTLARVFEIINGYTVTFEDGNYAVNLVGANSNISDQLNLNQVQVRASNSAGLAIPAVSEFATFQGAVWVDVNSTQVGTIYPAGTQEFPVNNLADAIIIASSRGFDTLNFISDYTFLATDSISNYQLVGRGSQKTTFTFTSGSSLDNCEVFDATVTGTVDGIVGFTNCLVEDLGSAGGAPSSEDVIFSQCYFKGSVTIPSNYSGIFTAVDSWALPDASDNPPVIDMGDSTADLQLRNWSGLIEIQNNTNANDVRIFFASGGVELDSTVTAGNFLFSGVGTITDNSTSVTSLDVVGLVSKEAISEITVGAVYLDVASSNTGTAFPTGTVQKPVNNLTDALAIAAVNNISTIQLAGTLTLDQDVSAKEFISWKNGKIDLNNQTCLATRFRECRLEGTMASIALIFNCRIGNLQNIQGVFEDCKFLGTHDVSVASTSAEIHNSLTQVSGGTQTFDMTNGGSLHLINFNGKIAYVNCTSAGSVNTAAFGVGNVDVEASCTAGTFIMTGDVYITDNSTGTANVVNGNTGYLVWDEKTADYTTAGTMGKAMSDAGAAGNPWSVPVSGNTSAGSFGELVGKKLLTIAKFLGLK